MNQAELYNALKDLGACWSALHWISTFPPDTPAIDLADAAAEASITWLAWLVKKLGADMQPWHEQLHSISTGLPEDEYDKAFNAIKCALALELLTLMEKNYAYQV